MLLVFCFERVVGFCISYDTGLLNFSFVVPGKRVDPPLNQMSQNSCLLRMRCVKEREREKTEAAHSAKVFVNRHKTELCDNIKVSSPYYI